MQSSIKKLQNIIKILNFLKSKNKKPLNYLKGFFYNLKLITIQQARLHKR